MSSFIENKIRRNRSLRKLYVSLGSWAVNFLRFFVKTDPKLIVFSSFTGRKYDDSPRSIYECMLNDKRFDNYKIVWFFDKALINRVSLPRGEKIDYNSLKAFVYLLKARVWVSDTSMVRRLDFRGKNTFYLQTWHGTPIKRLAEDIPNGRAVADGRNHVSVMLAQGQFEADIFKHCFRKRMCTDEAEFKIIGLPRNDELFSCNNTETVQRVRRALGIPMEKKVILYAPTFRDYLFSKDGNYFSMPFDLKRWERELGDEYVLLFRAHSTVAEVMGVKENSFVKDVSKYQRLNELMIASDILISDYSSIFFDYSILSKPMLCYAYDYDEYEAHRGKMYFDIRVDLHCEDIKNEDDILNALKTLDYDKRVAITDTLRNKYVQAYGHASQLSCDIIYDAIK